MRILDGEMRTETGVDALSEGRAFVDLSRWRKVAVGGGDAGTWLGDLVSADIRDLEPGRSRRSLLLSPTGGVRAEFTVAVRSDEILLLQDEQQKRSVETLLTPYVLSSDVRLADRTDELSLLAFPAGSGEVLELSAPAADRAAPSCAGDGGGFDVIAPAGSHDELVAALSRSHEAVDVTALDAWRVAAGIPRVAVESREGDLPDEIGLADAVAADKGCYLGQEAVAKARNLGHPRRVLVHVTAGEPIAAGDEVRSGELSVGIVTSAAAVGGGSVALARIRWDARDLPLTASGVRLDRVRRPGQHPAAGYFPTLKNKYQIE